MTFNAAPADAPDTPREPGTAGASARPSLLDPDGYRLVLFSKK